MPSKAVEELELAIDHFVHPDNDPKVREHDNLNHVHTTSTLTTSPNGTELAPVPRTIKSQIGNPVSSENVEPGASI